MRKFTFPDRVTDQWNVLPEEVMVAKNVLTLKEKYDNVVEKMGPMS